jgi:DNA-directed RNA polymerase subunit RPC12/RpoP
MSIAKSGRRKYATCSVRLPVNREENGEKPVPNGKKTVHLQQYKDVNCPVCGKFLFVNESATGQIVYKCKRCKRTVTVKL